MNDTVEKKESQTDIHKAWREFGNESTGMALGEVSSQITGFATFAAADYIVPKTFKKISKAIADHFVTPNLNLIETTLKKACKLKGSLPDMSHPPAVRAKEWGETLLLFAASWVTSMAAKLAVRKWCNKGFKVEHEEEPKNGKWLHDKVVYNKLNKHDWKIVAADEGVHLGSIVVMNTVAAKYTDNLINFFTKLFKNVGVDPKRSKSWAGYLTVWEVPNLLGLLAGLGVVGNHYRKKANASYAEHIVKQREEASEQAASVQR